MINLLTKPKKLLTTLVIVVVLSLVLVNLQNSLIAVSAQALPLVVYEDHLDFGLVFPGQIRDGYFRVFYSSDGGDGDVNYRLIQKRKPLPSTHPEYPNGGDPDLPGYYRDLCPYILKISQDGEGDTESSALVGPNDLMDIWKVELEVPAILDYVAQNHTGGVVSSNGEYGCDISVDIAVPNTSICGYKFFDLDENGQFAGNDYGLSSWTINLKQFDGQVWQTIKSELTAVNGYYCFEFLNPGTYRVEEVLKPNWANTTPLSQEVTISELENLNINFGNFLPGEGPRCVDADGDSFFKFSSVFCPQGNDCNDSNPNINPAALEVCDQADNDCDGYINEGNVCNPPECSAGNQQSCSTGLPGICSGGTQTCDQAGHWGSCVQNTPAITEFCDGLDNDCDGAVDEGGVCGTECSPPGSTQACNTGAPGICSAGTQTCDQFGNWDICVQNQPPTTEVCNGADDDCDGSIDEGGVCNPPECTAGNTQSCNTGLLGICSIGTKTCDQDGFWGSCVQTNSSSEEICNGADDDCDGAIDEGGVCGNGGECTPQTTRSCNTGQPGICSPGTQTCDSQGEWGSCIQDTSTATEVCDGADNNCDGAVDEGDVCTPPECTSSNTQACNTGQPGICSAGTQTCNQSGFWGSCVQDTSATAEVCDGADNDCDGVVDEGGVCGSGGECTPQATQACSTSLAGVCAAGTQTCSQLGQWGGCIQDNPATTEVCDQADNDCDGSVDEENVCGNGGGGNGGGSGGSFLALFIHTQSLLRVVDPNTVIITWFTNRPATSRVVYDTIPHPAPGTPPNYGYQWSTLTYNTSPKVTFHSVTITGLTPNTTYYFRPISAASPEVYGTELNFVTGEVIPPKETPPPSTPTPPAETTSQIPPPAEETGTVAGVSNEEETTPTNTEAQEPTQEKGKVLGEETTSPAPSPITPTNCATYIWLLLILNLIAAALVWLWSKDAAKTWRKNIWLVDLVLVIVPAIIWFAACWLVTWLIIILVLAILTLVVIKPKKIDSSTILQP